MSLMMLTAAVVGWTVGGGSDCVFGIEKLSGSWVATVGSKASGTSVWGVLVGEAPKGKLPFFAWGALVG